MLLILFYIISVILIYVILNEFWKPLNFPPGPRWLPFVGNLPELKKLSRSVGGQHIALLKLAKEYNTNVLGLKLGNEFVITVFSYETIREVCTREEFEGRPDNFFLRLRCMGSRRGITCVDGPLWSLHRQFVVRHLRDLGFGKTVMENMIQDEIKEIFTILDHNGAQINVGKTLAPAVINILWTLTTGKRISRDNPLLDNLLDLLEMRSKAFDMSGGSLNQFPWLRFLAPEWCGYNLIQQINFKLRDLFMATIEEHKKNWYEGNNDDVIYSFISEMKKSDGHSTSFTDEQLVMICLDLFIAGAQTTSNTLAFAFLMMILYPHIQDKVHIRLDECFKRDDVIKYADRQKVPYIEAVLLEVQRYCHVVPVSGPRRVLKDTTLEGYFLPKNATVLINLYSIDNDENIWKDPEVFRPERFLDENGALLSAEKLIPFGLGRRRCLGETLARHCIFLIFIEILKKYRVTVMPGMPLPSEKPLPGITLSPQKYLAQFIER